MEFQRSRSDSKSGRQLLATGALEQANHSSRYDKRDHDAYVVLEDMYNTHTSTRIYLMPDYAISTQLV